MQTKDTHLNIDHNMETVDNVMSWPAVTPIILRNENEEKHY
jgi:hypothetical protein